MDIVRCIDVLGDFFATERVDNESSREKYCTKKKQN